ncbi:MAG TPA: M28 family peptidase [Gemmatimonadales bacterium]|nr:M28 family peptidase [Gemmatimonadales bacterium]
MLRLRSLIPVAGMLALAVACGAAQAQVQVQPRRRLEVPTPGPAAGVERLIGALLGDTPLVSDLETLTDEIGGRATGSPANLRASEWALARFREAGVAARREAFTMPGLWLERSATATVRGAGIEFRPRIAALPFSTGTGLAGVTLPLVDAGRGADSDFTRLGGAARGAFVLIETDELKDLDGLFREYDEAVGIERRAFQAGAGGLVYMSSRPNDLLARHNASTGLKTAHPMLMMERDAAARALRLLRAGKRLSLTAVLDLQTGPAYQSFNVIGEIRGRSKAEEIVLIGAHLDSWDLGTGALDNGANAMMVLDIARQIQRLGLVPERTIRFALWSGEEQGLLGSFGYTVSHRDELDHTVMASAYDIGTGRITGYFTGGRADLVAVLNRALEPVAGLGPLTSVNAPIVGTDNYDFMMQGIANLVANQESANYGPNYHARSDEFGRADLRQLRLNAAIAAAVTWGVATTDAALPRWTGRQVDSLVRHTDLSNQMKSFGVWDEWMAGTRGLRP